jgi:hypothetical protein
VLLVNYNDLGDGTHRVDMYDGGVWFAGATFTVVTPGTPYLRNVLGVETITLSNGDKATVVWNESTQSFVLRSYSVSQVVGFNIPGLPFCEAADADRTAKAAAIDNHWRLWGLLRSRVRLCAVSTKNLDWPSVAGPFAVGDFVYYDVASMSLLQGAEFLDDYVLAHEWGHHLQFDNEPVAQQTAPLRELQADCFAGLYLGYITAAFASFDGNDLATVAGLACFLGDWRPDMGQHGTCEQRVAAVLTGAGTAVNAYTQGFSFDPFTVCSGPF